MNVPGLDAYTPVIQRWMPKAEIRPPGKALPQFDAVLVWKRAEGALRYLVEDKPHLRYQDVGVIVDRLNRRKAGVPPAFGGDRVLLLAPHVRPQQAVVLERAGIDYLDLAGNAHLEAPGLFVHVEGRQPPKQTAAAPARLNKGWIRAVMAMLIEPALMNAPYRTLAEQAGVALGTVAGCMTDLVARGLLLDRKDGRVIPDRQALVALWVQAYIDGLRPRLPERRLQVRAEQKEIVTRLQAVMPAHRRPWALTGADAADRRTHFFRVEETEIYAGVGAFEHRDLQKALVAQPAARGGNLLIIEPPGPLAIPAAVGSGPPVAPDLLVYAELRYRGTEQALEAAEQFLREVMNDAAH